MTTGSRLHVATLHRPWAERLAGMLGAGPGVRCIDLPCGDGALAAALARAGAHVRALDVDTEAVASCRDMAAALRLSNVDAGLFERPPPATAGAAGSLFTLPHRSDPPALLAAAAGAVRPGGRLAAAVWAAPDAAPPISQALAAFEAVRGRRPPALEAALSLGRPGALEALADSAGLGGARVERLRDVVRFDSAQHALTVVSSAYRLEAEVDALAEPELAALIDSLSQRLLRFAAWDGTLVVPVEAAVLYAEIGVE